MEAPQVPNPIGADAQYDLLFRSYLNSGQKTGELLSQIEAQLTEIQSQLTRVRIASATTSRFPGGSIVHLLFRRLLRRHLGESLEAVSRANQLTVESIRLTVKLWEDIYRHEIEMERRTRSGMLDRLAVVDAMQIQLELLEEDLSDLRSKD